MKNIDPSLSRIKAKIYLYGNNGDQVLCWYSFARKRKMRDDYIVQDMFKRIRNKYGNQLKHVDFYTNDKHPEIAVSELVQRLTYYDNFK
jgi:hypothetical protein